MIGTGCLGLCDAGPLVQVADEKGTRLYERVDAQKAARIATEDAVKGKPAKDLLDDANAPFFAKQRKIVLENSGRIDPERIESCVAEGAYEALQKAVTEMTPLDVIQQITASGLRGPRRRRLPDRPQVEHGLQGEGRAEVRDLQRRRGRSRRLHGPQRARRRSRTACSRAWRSPPTRSAPTRATSTCAASTRWRSSGCRRRSSRRSACSSWAAASSTRASQLPRRHPDRRRRLRLRRRDGADRLDRGQAAAPRGRARPTPPTSGLWGSPTLINNVETFANVAPIVRNGGAWYAAIGTEKSKGTKVFALAGKVAQHGPDRSADGHHAARDHLRDRRRHPRRQAVQGRADRRPLRRLHPGAVPGPAGRLRVARQASARSWARAA